MKLDIVRIGNSQGLRLPKALLEQAGIRDRVEVEVVGGTLVVRQARLPREGWAEAFAKAVAEHGQPEMLIPDTMANEFDEEEWVWDDQDDIQDASKSF